MSALTDRLAARRGRAALALALSTGLALLSGLGLSAGPAQAAITPAASWSVTPVAAPTSLAPDSTYADDGDEFVITATDLGGAAATAHSPITIADTLPAGITAASAGGTLLASGADEPGNSITCTADGQTVTCSDPQSTAAVLTDEQVVITIPVDVSSAAVSGALNQVQVSGGGAPTVTASDPATISDSPAAFGLTAFTAQSLNSDGSDDTQAGSTPNELATTVSFATTTGESGGTVPAGDLRDTTLQLPAGLVGDPTTVPACSQQQMDASIVPGNGCPEDSQIGIADLRLLTAGGPSLAEYPIYNLQAPAGMPAQFGFLAIDDSIVRISFAVRTGSDYGLTATITGTNSAAPLYGATIVVWGDPASSTNDDARFESPTSEYPGTDPDDPSHSRPIASTDSPAAFITNPTSCTGPVSTSISVDDWQAPTTEMTAPDAISPAGTGCAAEPFTPSASVVPQTTVASSPTGLDVDIHTPQSSDPTALAEANLDDATVTLPAGVSVSPSGANGLQACSEAEIGLSNDVPSTCPAASALGTVQVDTPLLSTPLEGSVYLAQQTANPFGSLLAIYISASADGVLLKLAGQVTANPTTGQLTTTFQDNPQLPFTDLELDFFGGPNAPLSTPSACGTYTTTSSLSPWSGMAAVTGTSSFTIDSGCMSGFAPTFTAGTTSRRAGRYSPFELAFSRSDTDEDLSGLQVTLPEGMLAKISGVGECSGAELASISAAPGTGAAQAADPSCPSSSLVGSASVAAGPGTDPYNLSGQVYLTGPYKGGPFGLAVVVPALAGPFDLGTVVVRQALYINPTTAQVTVTSDPFPTILDGIPLQLRTVAVDLDRHDFTVDPTSCSPMAVTGSLVSTAGAAEVVRAPFRLTGCSSLKFSPKLALTLSGAHQTAVGTHPLLTANLTQGSGQANLRSEQVTLPLSLALDPDNSEHVCLVAQAAKIACPRATIVGSAIAHTRILPTPLRGRVYLVQGERKGPHGIIIHTLPTLLIPLRGDNVAINLIGKTSVNRDEELVTTFPAVPDAGIRSFTLTITGGRRGILVVTGSRSLCSGPQVGDVIAVGHNGKRRTSTVAIRTTACRAVDRHPTRRRGHASTAG